MIHLDLSKEEKEVLEEVLNSYLSNLRYEISDTDTYEYKQQLKVREDVLNRIRNNLMTAT